MSLLSSFGKRGVQLGLLTLKVDIDDTTYLSKYFDVVEFNPLLTSGRNAFAFNGTSLLKENSEIKIECIDFNNNSLYIEVPKSNTQYLDVAKYLISIHVYNENYNGSGKLILVGTTKKNEVVRWIGNITIDKTINNNSKVRFYNKPTLEVKSLLYPVIDGSAGSSATVPITLKDRCFTFAVTPPENSYQKNINQKTTEIDYRLVINNDSISTLPLEQPTMSFNTQMEGQPVTINISEIQYPFSLNKQQVAESVGFKIKKVINSSTVQLDTAYVFNINSNNILTNISDASFSSSYKYITYNTRSDAYQKSAGTGGEVYIKESYANVVYRNIKPYTGYVARHKLYKKSLLYPGDFQLIADEPLINQDLLIDPVTINKTYNLLGSFYNQHHINKYWFSNSPDLTFTHSASPFINSVNITNTDFNTTNESKYVIVKLDSINIVNDSVYYPYVESQFLSQSGSSYNSNFIELKKDVLYVLSTNCILEKAETSTDSSVDFYFTGSFSNINNEINFSSFLGWKLGSISTTETISKKIFPNKIHIYFTPKNDYYGTLIIVPNKCSTTLSELSLKAYSDYGFSADVLYTRIPFKINIANETFQIKSELFDINSNLIYSDLQTIQSFDPTGESLYLNFSGSNFDPSEISQLNGNLTIEENLYVPNIPNTPDLSSTQAYRFLTYSPDGSGIVCASPISDISIGQGNNSSDYGRITSVYVDGGSLLSKTTTSLSIRYSFSQGVGRKIVITDDKFKETFG